MKIFRRRRPTRGTRPSTQPRPTAALLDGTFRWLKLDEQARSFAAMHAFAQAAAAMPRASENVRAERLRGSILYVRCASASWAQAVQMNKQLLLERLRRTAGGEGVCELRFNVGPLSDVVAWERPAARVEEPAAVVYALPDDVARALDAVDDVELREQLARLYGKLGSRRG